MKGKKHRTTFIRIQAGGVVDEIDAQHLEPSHWMLFVVSNEDTSNAPHKYTLSFDPQADIVNKETRAVVKNLLTTTALQKVAQSETPRVGFLRYNAFEDVGSDQSYALALLTRDGDGVVLSSIYSREETRTYGKAVLKFQTSQEASAEERAAIAQAKAATS